MSITGTRRLEGITCITVRDHQNPNLGIIHSALPPDKSMRHPPLEEFEQVYRQGRAAVALANNEVAGFVKLTERPDRQRREQVGIGADVPTILELGGALVLERFRNQGIYSELNRTILEYHRDKIQNGQVLIIGCTVTIPFLLSFWRSIPDGMNFKLYTIGFFHQRHPILSGLMCSCDPEDRYQDIFRLRQCPAEAPPSMINTAPIVTISYDEKTVYVHPNNPHSVFSVYPAPINISGGRDGKTPRQTQMAITFISDTGLGDKTEAAIRASLNLPQVGAGAAFRDLLRDVGYYGVLEK